MSRQPSCRVFREVRPSNILISKGRKMRGAAMSKIELSAHDFVRGIADALYVDYEHDPRGMVKGIGEDTGASLGAIKNWIAKVNGPTGEYVIKLQGVSPSVRAFVDKIIRRDDQVARRERKIMRALAEAIADDDDETSSEVIELIPTLQEDLFDRRPPAPSHGQRMADRARAASYGKTR